MSERVARVRIELKGLERAVWRRVDVPVSATLAALHDIVQIAMGWTFSHLYEFDIRGRVYGEPMWEEDDELRRLYKAKSLRLETVIARGVERFRYVYDFGDNWLHDVIVEGVRDGAAGEEFPAFVDGARRCPPEDVGGVHVFIEFLEAALDPFHEEHARMIEWYGGPFDPDDIDERRVRMLIEDMAARRRGPLASHRSGRRKARI